MKAISVYTLLSFVSLVCMGGCKYTNTPERANELMVSGWVGPGPCPTTAKEVYCYKTLGQIDCYSEPQEGWENRLVSYYKPPKAQPKLAKTETGFCSSPQSQPNPQPQVDCSAPKDTPKVEPAKAAPVEPDPKRKKAKPHP